jgi:hypothetical protein
MHVYDIKKLFGGFIKKYVVEHNIGRPKYIKIMINRKF